MKLWKISQTEVGGYDTFSDAVVAAPNEAKAKTIHPNRGHGNEIKFIPMKPDAWYSTWTNDPAKVTVEYLGNAKRGTPMGVICASFHAG